MRIHFIFVILITVLIYGCNQRGENDNSSTNSKNGAEQHQSESTEQQQSDLDTRNKQPQIEKGKILATVNGVPIYESDLSNMSLQNAITDEILFQEGIERGMDKEIEDQVMKYKKSLIVRSMKASILENLPPEKPVSDEEIREYYDTNIEKYRDVRMEEINFSDKSKGDDIKKMAGEGKTFEEIANNYPDSDVKFIDRRYNKFLTKYFETVDVGSITDVIEKNDGTYSILQIVDIRERPYKSVKNPIRINMEALRTAGAFNDFASNIAKEKNYNIEIATDSKN